MFVIRNQTLGTFAGWNFPKSTVSEYPDARLFKTKAEAEKALKSAKASDDWKIESVY